jgi:uncharacterized protein (DUF1778 family)
MKARTTEKRGPGRPATGQLPQHQFRCPNDEWELFQQAADAEGVKVAAWIRNVAVRAAKRVLQK